MADQASIRLLILTHLWTLTPIVLSREPSWPTPFFLRCFSEQSERVQRVRKRKQLFRCEDLTVARRGSDWLVLKQNRPIAASTTTLLQKPFLLCFSLYPF